MVVSGTGPGGAAGPVSLAGPVVGGRLGHGAGGRTEPGFDGHHAPSAERIADCVHCGFCLPACPTYALWGEEMDSPRGRILLMKGVLEGDTGLTGSVVEHFDRCLGCMACVTSCPSGVRYDELIEATRAQVERNHRRLLGDRLTRAAIFAVFPRPGRVRALALVGLASQRVGLDRVLSRPRVVARLPASVRALLALRPSVSLRDLVPSVPERTAAAGPARRRVGLLTGCVQRVFFAGVNSATRRVLAAEGCEVVAPRSQGCCGALMVHTGREAEALRAARALIDVFEAAGVETIVVNAAGCGSAMKDYGRLLADDSVYAERAVAFAAKVADVTEVLAELGPRAPRHPLTVRVAYHDACHLAHAQQVRDQPRRVLSAIPGLELVELSEPDMCCGSAGIYNLVQPEAGADLGRRKAATVLAAGADAVATANPGCLLQLRAHLGPGLPLLHPVELVDASISGRSLPGLGSARR